MDIQIDAGYGKQSAKTPDKTPGKTTWLSVGMKLIIGVGLVSNLCLGILIYTNWTTSRDVGEKTNALLDLNAGLNSELRERITRLQTNYLQIPDHLSIDPTAAIQKQIAQTYSIVQDQIFEGRGAYGADFKRKQRRDIAKGGFVVQAGDTDVKVSNGLLDRDGVFTDKVRQIRINSQEPDQYAETIKQIISQEQAGAASGESLQQKIVLLSARLADEGIAAEQSRTRILYHVEDIAAKEKTLSGFRQDKQKLMVFMACATLVMNLLVLYVMTWINVERPLKQLTQTIELINAGDEVVIPYQRRRDKIGVLAQALTAFQGALGNLRSAGEIKLKEQQVIQNLILFMTDLIEDLQTKAHAMKHTSFDLHELAGITENETDNASSAINRTVENIQGVVKAADQLQGAAQDIHFQVEQQNDLVMDINGKTKLSMDNIQDLALASKEIQKIVNIVKTIAGQSKLLALNARIEAARAGAAGKGFIVVANEVRDLSLKTEAANQEIQEKITAIQGACGQMINSTRKVEHKVQVLSQTGACIYEAVKRQHSLSNRIAKTAQNTEEDVQDLSQRVSTVKEGAQRTRRLSEDTRAHAQDMAAALTDLLGNVNENLGKIGDIPNHLLTRR